MNEAVIIPAQSGSVAKQLCTAQLKRAVPVEDRLLALIVVLGAVFACWIVLFQQHRKRPQRASDPDGSSGSDAGGEGGSHGANHGWFDGHGHSGDHGGSGDTGGSDGGGDGGGGDSGGGGD
jgi:hypothetical protein